MPHNESRTPCAIWDSEKWTSMPIDCQWYYLMLRSQFSVSKAGVVAIPRREWTDLAADEDIGGRLARARKLCEERNYIAVDDKTDEVLLRGYLRTDIMSGPPGTFRAAMDAIIAVRSEKLRVLLRGELLRLDVAKIEAKGAKVHRESPLEAYHRALAALGHGPRGGREVPGEDTTSTTGDGMEDGILDGIPMGSSEIEDGPTMASSESRDAIPMPSLVVEDGIQGCHPDAIGDAPVVVDVAVEGSSYVDPSVQFKEAAAPRADTRARTRDAHVRAAQLVVAVLPRTLGNRLTREGLHTRLGERLVADTDGELTDDVVRAALSRWVQNSRVAPAAIDWMLDDAIKESRGALRSRRGGRIGTEEIVAAGRDLVAHYKAQEAAEEYAEVHPIHRGAM